MRPVAAALRVSVNGEPREVAAGCRVADLLDALGLTGRRVAVAVNRHVIPRSRFATAGLADGDAIEILEAVGGG